MPEPQRLTAEERDNYSQLTDESLAFLRQRYNRASRWVIADLVGRNAARYPDKPALVFRDVVYTYSALETELNRFANALLGLGLQRNDRVCILAHNTVHHVLAWLGSAKAGCIYLAVNYMLRDKDISYVVNHSESKVFIVEDSLYGSVQDVLSDLKGVKTLIWSRDGQGRPTPDHWTDFDTWYRAYPPQEPDVELHIEDPVQMTYTSGTESLPKAVVLTNQALLSEYMGMIVDGDFKPDDVVVHPMPLYHCAQRDCFLTPSLWVGATNVLLFQAEPKAIMEAVHKYAATMLFVPPTVWIGILRHPDRSRYDLTSLRKCYYGASIMPAEVLKELMALLPKANFYNLYGQTELSPYHTVLKPEHHLSKLGSAGKAGLNMETRLEDDVHVPGSRGEICGRGPHVMLMYFKDPDSTEKALAHGWFHSGDIGEADQDGYITVADRKKDMIKSGGENVSSREVEEVVYRNRKVSEVAVVGLPHQRWIEAVTAVVVPKQGESIDEAEVLVLCKTELAGFKVPKGIIIVDELPKNPSGKILKRDLRQRFASYYAAH